MDIFSSYNREIINNHHTEKMIPFFHIICFVHGAVYSHEAYSRFLLPFVPS